MASRAWVWLLAVLVVNPVLVDVSTAMVIAKNRADAPAGVLGLPFAPEDMKRVLEQLANPDPDGGVRAPLLSLLTPLLSNHSEPLQVVSRLGSVLDDALRDPASLGSEQDAVARVRDAFGANSSLAGVSAHDLGATTADLMRVFDKLEKVTTAMLLLGAPEHAALPSPLPTPPEYLNKLDRVVADTLQELLVASGPFEVFEAVQKCGNTMSSTLTMSDLEAFLSDMSRSAQSQAVTIQQLLQLPVTSYVLKARSPEVNTQLQRVQWFVDFLTQTGVDSETHSQVLSMLELNEDEATDTDANADADTDASHKDEGMSEQAQELLDKLRTHTEKRQNSRVGSAEVTTMATGLFMLVAVALAILHVAATPDIWALNEYLSMLGLNLSAFHDHSEQFRVAKVISCIVVIGLSIFNIMSVMAKAARKTSLRAANQPIVEIFEPPSTDNEALLQLGEDTDTDSAPSSPADDGKDKKAEDEALPSPYDSDEEKERVHRVVDEIAEALANSRTGHVQCKKVKELLDRAKLPANRLNALFKGLCEGTELGDVSMKDVVALRDAALPSANEMLFSRPRMMVTICFSIAITLILLLTTGKQGDILVALGGLAGLVVFAGVLFVRVSSSLKSRSSNSKDVYAMLLTVVEAAITRIATLVFFVAAFAIIYHFIMRKCTAAEITCASGVLPVCSETGFPPKYRVCGDGAIQCEVVQADMPAVCPTGSIPGAKPDNKQLSPTMGYDTPFDIEVAATDTSMCQTGNLMYLCSSEFHYAYAKPGVVTFTQNLFRFGKDDIDGDVGQVVVGDRGTNCASTHTPLKFEDFGMRVADWKTDPFVPVFTPSGASGAYDLCYRLTTDAADAPFRLLKGGTWEAVLVIGEEASCTSPNCARSDFTSSMSSSAFDSIYFSMVTHSTVGYGDIYPTSKRGMLLVLLQALVMMVVGMIH